MLQALKNIDTKILLLINGAHDPLVDFIMFWASDRFIWIPFYIWLLYVLYRNYGKKILWFLPVIALLIAGCDQLSGLLKNNVHRFRPCHTPSIENIVHLVNNYCGGSYGFVSSHAANSMGLATFIIMMLPKGYKDLQLELFAYVLLIAYSRVYLAAHFPLDILGGWIIGFSLGFFFAKMLQKKIPVPLKLASGHE